MRHLIAILLLLATSRVVAGEQRLQVNPPDQRDEQAANLFSRVEAAVNAGDYQAYKGCFTKKAQDEYCKDRAIFFAADDLSLEVKKTVQEDVVGKRSAYLVRYTVHLDGAVTEHVSRIELIHDGLEALIEREQIVATEYPQKDPYRVPGPRLSPCMNGRCQAPRPPLLGR